MDNKKKAIVFIVLCTIFTSTGQILWKLGLSNITDLFSYINIPLILGFVSYGIGLLLMLAAFEKGDLSVVYPILATSYVWVSLFSPLIFPTDSMNMWKWVGVLVILVSVSILGYGSTKKSSSKDVIVHG